MEIDILLNDLFSLQEDWSVTTSESTYIVVPNGNNEPENEE